MKQEIIKSELEVNDNKIKVITINNKEFISLTDLARYANPEEPKIPIQTWMRNKDVIAYLGLWEKLNNENAMLQTKISSLEEKLKEEKVSEIKVTEAIMAARDTSDRIKSLAREEANMIVEEARNNANAIVHEALLNAEKTEHEAMLLKKNITVYKNRVKNIIKSQLEIAEDLDKYDLDN